MDLIVDFVDKLFGSHRVLEDISFVLKGGKILAVLGPNGSGKSTLIKTITRIHFPRPV
ncbi:MAG: ATP-binding cassette domain-containing protein [Methanoregula sp.]|nr:ATP-binding cassette domain-containing protein [Methanoregula sp.]